MAATVRTIRLERVLRETHAPRRMGKAMRFLKEDIARHAKSTPDSVVISGGLNKYMLLGSAQGYSRVKIAVEKDGGKVNAYLDGEKKAAPKKEEKAKEKKEAKPKEETKAAQGEAAKKEEKPVEKNPSAI